MRSRLNNVISISIVMLMLLFTSLISFQGMQSIDNAAAEQCGIITSVFGLLNDYALKPYFHCLTILHYYASRPGTAKYLPQSRRKTSAGSQSSKAPMPLFGKIYMILASAMTFNRFELLLLLLALAAAMASFADHGRKSFETNREAVIIEKYLQFLEFLSPHEKYLKVRVKQFYIDGVIKYFRVNLKPVLVKDFTSTGFFYALTKQ